MTKKQKKIISCIALTGAFIISGALVNVAVNADVNKKKSVDYALQYSRYVLEESNAIVTYNGVSVDTVNGAVTFKEEGIYKIEYRNEIVTVNVYKYAPDSTYVFEDTLSTVVTGLSYEIPEVSIIDFLGNKIVNYSVSIELNDSVVYTVESNKLDSYTFAEEGEYTVSYSYENIFGTTDVKEMKVVSAHKKVIVAPDFANETFTTSDLIDVKAIYGFYKGTKYDVIVKVDGRVEEDFIRFEEDKVYNITLQSEVDGEILFEQYKINVSVDYSKMFTTTDCISVSETLEYAPQKVTTYRNNEGVRITTETSNSTATYSGILDLNTVSNTENIVEFHVLSNDKANMDFCNIYLTDIYDESNWICIQMVNCADGGGVDKIKGNHSYLSILTSTGYSRNNAGVNHAATFYAKYKEVTGMFNFQMDYASRTLYYYSGYGDHQKLIDLDDPTVIPSEKLWNGFTTGEVYVKLQFSSVTGKESGVIVTQIGGKNLNSLYAQKEQFNTIKLDSDIQYDKVGMPVGVVGTQYQIPSAFLAGGNETVQTNLYDSNGRDITSSITNNSFTPSAVGNYKIVYNAYDVFGREISLTLPINVVSTHEEIKISIDNVVQPQVGTYWEVPTPTVTGGHGELSVTMSLLQDGKEVVLDNAGQLYIDKPCVLTVKTTVKDFLGYESVREDSYEVIYNDVFFDIDGLPSYLKAGQIIKVPQFQAYNFALGPGAADYGMTAKVYINDISYKAGNNFTVAASLKTITFRFVADEGKATEAVEVYTVSVDTIPETGDMSLYFDAKGAVASTEENYQLFTFNQDTTVTFKNVLVAENLNLQFGLENGKANFSYFEIIFTDFNDKNSSISLEVYPYDSKYSTFENNGKVAYIPGSYTGAKYDIYYNNTAHALQSAVGARYMTINSTVSGSAFKGFESGLVYVSFVFHGVNDQSQFKVFILGNQAFNTYAYSRGDRKGPMLSFGKEIETVIEVKLSEVYEINHCDAYDVLQGKSAISVSVVSPSEKVIYKDVNLNKALSFTADEYGYWRITYTGIDSYGNKEPKVVHVYVLDEIAPELSVSSQGFKTNYKVGEAVTIPQATFSDNQGGYTAKVYVLTPWGAMEFVELGGTFTLSKAGKYSIVYYVRDVDNNVARTSLAFTVS